MISKMNWENINNTIRNNSILLIGIVFGSLFWIIEALIHTFVFKDGNFFEQTQFTDPNEIWMRFLAIGLIFIFSILAQTLIKKRLLIEKELVKHRDRLEEMVGQRTTELHQEITSRKQMEEALQRSEKRLRTIIDIVPSMIFVKNEEGRFLTANKAVSDSLGMQVDEIVGKKHADVHPDPDEVRRMLKDDRRVLKSGCAIHVPSESYSDSTGAIRWLHTIKVPCPESIFGEPAILGIAMDITERKQAMDEFLFKKNIIISSSSIIATSDLKGIMTYGNPSFLKTWGFEDSKEFLGKHFSEFWVVKDRLDEIMKAIMNKGMWSGEMKAKRKDGTLFDVQVSAATVCDMEGVPIALTSTSLDITKQKQLEENINFQITQRKQTEEQLKILVSDLKVINKELQDFAYIASHDLKAPLRGISSLASWLLEDYSDVLDKKGRDYLGKLLIRTKRMHNLIDGILQYSRVGRIEVDPQNLECNEVIQKTIDLLSPPESITVRVEGTLPTVIYDKTLLTQIFKNLIENAIKHLGKPTGEVVISCTDQEIFWEFCVKDNGVGIEERHFERVFKMFQSLKAFDDAESTGIGLSIVKKIIEQSGGIIWIDSIVGKKSAFYFTIPKHHNFQKTKEKYVILIVDDNVAFIDVVTTMLENEGHKVLCAKSGPEAYRILETHPSEIDTVIFDVLIPGEDTLERYNKFKKLRPEMKIIICSGANQADIERNFDKKSVDGVLTKPFKLNELNRLLRARPKISA